MAEIIWTDPALADLEAIADYIALENTHAAIALVQRVYAHVGQLGRSSRYRQIVEPPCRVFYRFDGERVYVLHVMRGERLLRPRNLFQPAG